jgi:hypothetical protein
MDKLTRGFLEAMERGCRDGDSLSYRNYANAIRDVIDEVDRQDAELAAIRERAAGLERAISRAIEDVRHGMAMSWECDGVVEYLTAALAAPADAKGGGTR